MALTEQVAGVGRQKERTGPTRLFHRSRTLPSGSTGRSGAARMLVDEHRGQGLRAEHDDRLDRLVERRCDEFRRFGRAQHPAVEAAGATLTYDDLDAAANRLARFLHRRRVGPGDRVAVLLDRATDTLTAQLAIAKLGAAWVPLDTTLPDASVAAVLAGSGAGMVVTTAGWAPRLVASDVDAIYLDRVAAHVHKEEARRLEDAERTPSFESPAYVVVHGDDARVGLRATAVGHQAVTNFVQVAAELFGLGAQDRVFHDPRAGSDLAVLETWLPWTCGATVVTPPAGAELRGPELGRFLRERKISVLRADPAMLAGVDTDLPDLRLLLLSGTEHPSQLIARWQRTDRQVLGVHGAPETTVAALWAELRPNRRPTLGRPLPTYGVVVLDPTDPRRPMPRGGIGEIAITGLGVARGYVGRENLTREAFLPGAGSTRVFRTGDLGRITPDDEVERIARLDGAAGRGLRTRPLRVPAPPARRGPVRRNRTSIIQLPPSKEEFGPAAPPRPGAPGKPGPAGRPGGPAGPAAPLRGPGPGRVRPPAWPTPSTGVPQAPPANLKPPTPPAGLRPPPAGLKPSSPETAKAPPAAATGVIQAQLAELLAGVLGRDDVPPNAHFFDDLGADSLLMARFCAQIRKHPELPSAAMQDIYQNTTLAKLAVALTPVSSESSAAVTGRVQVGLAEVLSAVLSRKDVPADAHFFDDLGADSMSMARFCAQVRKNPALPSVSMQDVYRYPTLAALAPAIGPARSANGVGPNASNEASDTGRAGPRAGAAAYVLCGAAQLLCFLGYSYLTALFLTWAYEWLTLPLGLLELFLRAVAVGSTFFLGLSVLPVLLKWVLVGRWRPSSFPVWSFTYLRFWIVKTLVRTSPMGLFAGSPLYTLYLRALGAQIGRGVVVLAPQVVCTDVLSIGEGTLVRKDAMIACYRAQDGYIEIGGVSLGANVVIGEQTVLDIRTTMGDGATLSHSSSLHAGQTVPAGETWNGTPGRRTDTAAPTIPPAVCGRLRRTLYPLAALVLVLTVILPGGITAFALVHELAPQVESLFEPGPGVLATGAFYVQSLVLSALLYFGALVVGLGIVVTLPRLLARGLQADQLYPLYGLHYWLHQAIVNLTNVKPFIILFGDSSAITSYLGLLGYRLRPMVQTGSNFGLAVKHENPYLTSVGTETVVADGLSVMNADYTATSFRVSHTAIGARNFLGNRIAYPPQGRTGDDCLLATKVEIPVEGPIRTGVGLLGSPSFEIPRSVARDRELDAIDPAEVAKALRRKNRHNALTMVQHLLARFVFGFLTLLTVAVVASIPIRAGALEIVIAQAAILLLMVAWFVLVERLVFRHQALAPEGCSIYDRRFWGHERYWKVPPQMWVQMFNGTPFKTMVWRMQGVRVGKRVFDNGLILTEKGFTTIGDECTLNATTTIQCHSQEDGGFKSERVMVGPRVTLGVGAFVHYGTTVEDGAVLEADTFLMKGEEVPAGERWGGNPARQLATHR